MPFDTERARRDPAQQQALKSMLGRVMERQQDAIIQQVRRERRLNHEGLNHALEREVEQWGDRLLAVLNHQSLSAAARREITLLERCRALDPAELEEALPAFRLQLKGNSPMEGALRTLAEKLPLMPISTLSHAHDTLIAEWEQSLEQRHLAEQLALLDEQRAELLSDLYRRLEGAEDLSALIPVDHPSEVGRLWDMADVALSRHQMKGLTQLADFLGKQPEIQRLASQIGKMAKASNRGPLKRVKEKALVSEQRFATLPEEVAGVQQGKDLGRLLAVATSLLSTEELELLFFKQLIDSQLLIYEMKGKMPEKGQLKPVFRHRRADIEDNGGPFILCIDTSASMAGQPERCAKALALALMREAVKGDRDCRVMIFSTAVTEFDLLGGQGLSQARDFLGYRFHGGTDISKCIEHACDALNLVPFANADVVVVSDFIAPRLKGEALTSLEAAQQRGNRFHAVALSREGNVALLEQMNHHWPMETSIWGRVKAKKG
ncbi:VWA domain-containing protein [Ferrimonas balearica]|uniref:VWA domain-containing protein n=1 Tax=Ferrimonas balearica TaxID=44012 RepID=UPI001C9A09AE|nr:VWA domain-containing protein [Ferrimonas balearica]MBY5921559.1 VWA domain-containing protein [Ferrimonas balearica]MBY5995101.1 VWA domain-containing protein [Ferrimonas balearica]